MKGRRISERFQVTAVGLRRRGEVDTVDVVTGVVLLILMPVLCLVFAGMFGLTTRTDRFDFREKPVTDPVPDQEEIDAKFSAAQAVYLQSGRPFLETAEGQRNLAFREGFRRWATECLQKADSDLQQLGTLINKYPETRSTFSSYQSRISQMREDIRRDIERARALDVLGRDAR